MQRQTDILTPAAGGDVGIVPTSHDQPLAWLGHGPAVLGLIGAYLLMHIVLRLTLSPTLGIDDAEQTLFAQHWAFGYRFRQPPLFTWLLLPVIEAVGPGGLAVTIVRYALLALTYGCLYFAACYWIADRRLAALSVFSFATIYVFAYYAHHDLTHTTALAAMIAATLLAFTHLCQRPTLPSYLMFGFCVGLGMLSKWNFVMLALGLPLTCLLFADYRKLVLSWKSLAATAVTALIITPTALWIFDHGQSTGGVSSDILSSQNDPGHLELMVEGGTALLTSIALFPLPFLPIFLVFFGKSLFCRPDPNRIIRSRNGDPSFLGWLMLVILALHVLLIPLFGAVNFTERWMHPALMILPIYLFGHLSARQLRPRSLSFYLGVIAIFVAVAVGARLYRSMEGVDDCGKCREFAPFAELAADLSAAGFGRGTIVADGLHVGGNLKMAFPESRVIDPAFPLALWPSRHHVREGEEGMCLLVWRDDQPDAAARRGLVSRFAEEALHVPTTAPRVHGRVEAMLYRSSTRRYALGFELIREGEGGCR